MPVRRALIARAAEGRDVLPDALRARGASVDVVALYETVPEPLSEEARDAAAAADYVLFTSASSVRFFAAAGGSLSGPRLVSIGPATSEELRAHGAEPDLEADPHTPDGLIAALLRHEQQHRGSRRIDVVEAPIALRLELLSTFATPRVRIASDSNARRSPIA